MKKFTKLFLTFALLFGVMGGVNSVKAGNSYLEINTNSVKANTWEWAIWYQLSTPLESGETYVLTMDAKCSESYSMSFWPLNTGEGGKTLYTGYSIGTEWSGCTCEFTANDNLDRLSWNFGSLNGTLCFDNVKLVKKGETTNLVEGGDFESGLDANWGNDGWNSPEYSVCTTVGTPKKCLKMTTNEVKTNAWEWAVWYHLDTPLESGKTYVLTMKAKCSETFNMPFWPYNSGEGGKTNYTSYNIGTEWGNCSCTFTAVDDLDYLKWCFGSLNGTVWFDDVSLVEEGQSTNLINGGDFENGMASNWGDDSWNKPDYSVAIDYPVFTLEFNENGFATTDKQYLTTTGGLSYNTETGVVSSDGTAGTLVLEFDSPIDLSDLNTFTTKSSAGNGNIVNRLKFYDKGGNLINTWNNAKWSNTGLDGNATRAFKNNNPVKKLVWESDEEAAKASMTFTITGIEWQKKTIAAMKGTSITTLPYKLWSDDGDNDATIAGDATPTNNIGVLTSGVAFGSDAIGDSKKYVDLTNCQKLIVRGYGNIRLFYNWVESSEAKPQTTLSNNTTTSKTLELDIPAFMAAQGISHFHLVGIKAPWGQELFIESISVLDGNEIYDYTFSGKGGLKLSSAVEALADVTATSIDATALTNSTEFKEALNPANPNCLVVVANKDQLSNTKNVIAYDSDAGKNICANLELTDGEPFKAPVAFTATAAKFTKPVSAAGYATMVIPFTTTDLPAGVDAAYELTAVSGEKITSSAVDALTADKPVMIKAAENASGYEFTASNVDVAATADGLVTNGLLNGTYAGTTAAAGANNYVLQKNGEEVNFYLVTETAATIKPFRAYLTAPAGGARLFFDFESTGITNANVEAPANNRYYNLQGVEVAQPTKGLYIVNGKKVVLK